MEIKILKIKQGRKRPEICIKWGTLEKDRESFGIIYTGYPLFIVKNIHGLPIIHKKIIQGLPFIHSKDYTRITH